jgi:tetratricopeptide (TPR) repeat protein
MMKKLLNTILFFAILLCSITGIWYSQKKLDKAHPEDAFMEMMYLPQGHALKVAAMGFDAPLADCLYIKTLIYWSKNINALKNRKTESRYLFLHKAFDAVTDLSPYFYTAYINGGLLLSASNKNEEAVLIFEKGIKNIPNNWQLHLHLAGIAMTSMEDRELARKHYYLASKCPGVPQAIIGAWRNLELDKEGEKIDNIKKISMMIATWKSVLDEKGTSRELSEYAKNDIINLRTLRLCKWLKRVTVKSFLEKNYRPLPEEAINDESLPELARSEFKEFPFRENDWLAVLPDCRVVSIYNLNTQINVLEKNLEYAKDDEEKNKIRQKLHDMKALRATCVFTTGFKRFININKRKPSRQEVIDPKYIKPVELEGLKNFKFTPDIKILSLPDGTIATKAYMKMLMDSFVKVCDEYIQTFRERENRYPDSIKELVEKEGLQIPYFHPLRDAGYSLNYDKGTGKVSLSPEI